MSTSVIEANNCPYYDISIAENENHPVMYLNFRDDRIFSKNSLLIGNDIYLSTLIKGILENFKEYKYDRIKISELLKKYPEYLV